MEGMLQLLNISSPVLEKLGKKSSVLKWPSRKNHKAYL